MRHVHRCMIAAFLALGALLPGAAAAQYWDKPGYGYRYAPPPPVYYAPPRPFFSPPPPVYYAPPRPLFYAPPVYHAWRPHHDRHFHGHRRHW